MDVSVQFLGGAGEVTGSKYLLDIQGFKLLLDCGLFQGRRDLRDLNRNPFPIEPSGIDAVVLTHAHLDHTGYLPKLFKDGFRGPVYCTEATADLMNLILMDSAKIQVEEANYAIRKGFTEEECHPLYTPEDVLIIHQHLRTCGFDTLVQINDHISAKFSNAGHILGAAIVELFIQVNEQRKKIVFSGDLGRSNDPILFRPQIIEEADILFVESTYGDRVNSTTPREDIIQMMNEVFDLDGNLVIPAFAIGRTQNLLMYLKNVLNSREIPGVRVVVDSPMAITATGLYRQHQAYHKLRGIDLEEDESFMTLRKHLIVTQSSAESKSINDFKTDTIIIASGGMMTGGRVMHHLMQRLPDPRNAILIAGYQAAGSNGRKLQDGAPFIRIFGKEIPVRARVFNIKGLSGHADKQELLEWLDGFVKPPSQTFVVHGEQPAAGALSDELNKKGWKARIPVYLEVVELFKDEQLNN